LRSSFSLLPLLIAFLLPQALLQSWFGWGFGCCTRKEKEKDREIFCRERKSLFLF